MRTIHSFAGILAVLTLIGMAGCSKIEPVPADPKIDSNVTSSEDAPPADSDLSTELATENVVLARAELHPTQGNEVKGMVQFIREPDGIRVVADVTGLTPGEHGFHVHEKGDCSAPDGTSAGGHFNPTTMPHAGPDVEKRHAGDLGNLTADAEGKAHLERLDTHLKLDGENTIIGRSVIVHANPDDLTSQPTGNAGGRVACGVIKDVIE